MARKILISSLPRPRSVGHRLSVPPPPHCARYIEAVGGGEREYGDRGRSGRYIAPLLRSATVDTVRYLSFGRSSYGPSEFSRGLYGALERGQRHYRVRSRVFSVQIFILVPRVVGTSRLFRHRGDILAFLVHGLACESPFYTIHLATP